MTSVWRQQLKSRKRTALEESQKAPSTGPKSKWVEGKRQEGKTPPSSCNHQQPTHPQHASKRHHVYPKEDCERARCQSIPPRTSPWARQQCQHGTHPRKKSSPKSPSWHPKKFQSRLNNAEAKRA